MAVEERARRVMIEGLEAALGPEVTDVLLQHLPPAGSDLATKDDLLATKEELRLELREVRSGLATLDQRITYEVGGLRTEMQVLREELRTELHNEIRSLRQELGGEIGSVRQELGGEIGSVRQELGGEIGSLRQELGGDIAMLREKDLKNLRLEMMADMHREFASQTKAMIFGLAATLAALAGMALAVGQIMGG